MINWLRVLALPDDKGLILSTHNWVTITHNASPSGQKLFLLPRTWYIVIQASGASIYINSTITINKV